MKTKSLSLLVILAFCSTLLPAQGRGGSQRGGSRGQGPAVSQGRQRGQMGNATKQQAKQKDRDRIRATDQQRDRLRTCDQTAKQVRAQARQMARDARGSGFNADLARQQRDQLRERLQTMQQEHAQFMSGLSEQQRNALQNRIQNMDRLHERIQTQFQEVDTHLNQDTPNGKMVRKHARDLEQSMKEWQKQYRKMESEMSAGA